MLNPFRIVQPDPRLLLPILAAALCGAIMVPSAAVSMGDGIWLRHWAYLGIAFVAFTGALLVPTRVVQSFYLLALVAALTLCVLVLLPGLGREVKGAQRWLDLGVVTLQSGEAAKVLVLIYLAGFLARHGEQVHRLRGELLEPIGVLLLFAVLLLLAPDFGSVVVIGGVVLGLLFLAGVPLRLFAVLASLAILAGAVVAVWQPYRVARLTAFIDPWGDAYGSGYQLTQSLIAFGRGGFFGVGLGEGVQKLYYLPEPHNDFIFAVVAEELGLVGCLALILLFSLLVVRLLGLGRQAIRQDFWFGGYLFYGIALLLGSQFLINVGVSCGVLPTKGLTLPLVSSGGNALLGTGLLLGLACRAQYELTREPLAPRQRRAVQRAARPRVTRPGAKAATGSRRQRGR